MPAAPPAPPTRRLDASVEFETPDLVSVSYELAGVGSRAAAAFVDTLLVVVTLVVLDWIALSAARAFPSGTWRGAGPWFVAAILLSQFAVFWGYFVLFEGLNDGQTPGKRWLGLRVVQDGGFAVTPGVAALRNLLRVVDAQPGFAYVVGILAAVLSPRGKRLGDLVAGTIVVRERVVQGDARAAVPAAAAAAPGEAPRRTLLDDDAYTLLERFASRRGEMDAERAGALARQLARRFHPALEALAREEAVPASDAGALARLLARERAARAAGAVVTGATGARRERHAIVARGSARWAAFAERLALARRRGLAALGEDAVSAFAADYRDAAADLARLRTATAGQTSDDAYRLGRLVAAGHNLLYRRERSAVREAGRYLARTLPGHVLAAARPALLAAALLFGPAAIAGVTVARRPALAPEFISPVMLERAAEGVRRARERTGYIEDPGLFRPVMAGQIIANNVQVTFGAFALGVTAGLGTVLLLVVNGVQIGGVLGLYASKGILPLLLAFIAPHGVLELSAICIGGGAGFLLAAAILLPGARTRRDALVINGRRAVHLVAAATLMLVVAGLLEGLVSPIATWTLGAKVAVSAATAVVFAAWLSLGRARRRSP
jgi:uncharacterized membrane protein SpoIIM required for sporulation/uncharacterized RDD family membrane protein YckC